MTVSISSLTQTSPGFCRAVENVYLSRTMTIQGAPERRETMLRLHIGLSRALQNQLVGLGPPGIEAFARELGVSLASRPDRLELFGILTCDAPASRIPAIEAAEGVEFVQRDGRRQVAEA